MAWWAAAGLGLNLVGAGFKWQANQNAAALERERLDEEIRRFRAQAAQVMGHAESRVGASGFAWESAGLQGYLRGMSSEFDRQAEFMRRVGLKGIRARSRASDFSLIADIGSALSSYGAANNWWQGATG